MCSIRLVSSIDTHAKGVVYCISRINDLEKAIQTKYCRFTEFTPLFSLISRVMEELLDYNDEAVELAAAKYRLQKLQVSLEKRSIEWLSTRIREYIDFVIKKSPAAIRWEYRTICMSINQFAGEVYAFHRQASFQRHSTCQSLMMQLIQSKTQMDVHFEGGFGGIDFVLQPPPSKHLIPFQYASGATLFRAAEYYSGQLEDFATQIRKSETCQYIKFKPSFDLLTVKINELALHTDARAMQERLPEIQILMHEQCIDSLQSRIIAICNETLAMTVEDLVANCRLCPNQQKPDRR